MDAGTDLISSAAGASRTARESVEAALVDTLTEINLDDLFDAAGLSRLRRTPLQWVLRPWARRFALVAHEFDQRVAQQGLAQGSSWLLHRMAAGAQVSGLEHVPATGATVILANHPGMTDTVALLACLASRADLRVIALDRPFLRALPHVARQLIFVPDDEVARMGVVRAGARHLKQGGALLTFAAGAIEPDPAICGRRQAVESVQRWSDSFVLFARLVPQTRFVPAIVSHVVSPAAQRHPLTFLRRSAHDRQRLAAALQVALPRFQKLMARVAFGPPQQAWASDAGLLRSAIVAQACQLIDRSSRRAETGTAHEPAGPPQGRLPECAARRDTRERVAHDVLPHAERPVMPWPVI